MKTEISDIQTSHRMRWEHGEHSGTITFPENDREPAHIEWDGDCPDEWEEIEEQIEAAACDAICAAESKRKADASDDGKPGSPAQNASDQATARSGL